LGHGARRIAQAGQAVLPKGEMFVSGNPEMKQSGGKSSEHSVQSLDTSLPVAQSTEQRVFEIDIKKKPKNAAKLWLRIYIH
jgi:hypothetical protein